MMQGAQTALDRVIAALTYDQIEQRSTAWRPTLRDGEVPLLDRSIGQDLIQIEMQLGGRGTTLLSKIAESINEALLAAQEAREALGTANGSNVKPAPGLLDQIVLIPLKGKLVDQPRPSEESPIHEPAPETFPSPDEGDATDNDVPGELSKQADGVGKANKVGSSDDDQSKERGNRAANGGSRSAGTDHSCAKGRNDSSGSKAGRVHGQAGVSRHDRTAGPAASAALQPNDSQLDGKPKASRLDLIRNTARDLREQRQAEGLAPIDVPNIGMRQKPVLRASEKRAAGLPPRRQFHNLPPMPFEQRRARLDASIAFLKRMGILVSVVDRDAQIRKYRVTGTTESVLLEQVVEIAVKKGMQP